MRFLLRSHLVSLLRSIALVWVMVCAIGASSTVAHGADVLIVLSAETGPYKAAADEADRSLKKLGHSANRQQLEDIDLESLTNRTGPVIAIGGNAAVRLEQVLPESTALYYCMTPTPERLGLTRRTNTSGVSTDPDIAMQIELIDRSGIRVRRVGMLYRSSDETSKALRDRFESALPRGWTLSAIDLDSTGSVASSIDALFDAKIDLVWTAADPAVFDSALVKALLLRSIRDRVPMFGFSHALVRAGAPLGVGFEPQSQGRRVAEMLDAGELGVHDPSATQFAINETALERIGLKLSSELDRLAELKFGSD